MDLKLTNPEHIFKHGVSPSMVKLWTLCHRRWYNNYIRQLKTDAGVEATFGTAWHTFQRGWYNPAIEQPNFDNLIETFRKDFPVELNNDKRDQAKGVQLIRAYPTAYPHDTEPFKVLSVETNDGIGEIVPLEGCDYPLHIVIDALIETKIGDLYVMDHKSSTYGGAQYFDKFHNDYQVYCYIYGMQKKLGKRVEGMKINAVAVKKAVNRDSFLRQDFEKNEDQVKYHMGHFAKIANEMIVHANKYWQDPEAFGLTNDGNACNAFFRKCPYSDMCQFCDNTVFAKEILAKQKEIKT